jgi:hypothetical protein
MFLILSVSVLRPMDTEIFTENLVLTALMRYNFFAERGLDGYFL